MKNMIWAFSILAALPALCAAQSEESDDSLATIPAESKLLHTAYSEDSREFAFCVESGGINRIHFQGRIAAEHKRITALAISPDGSAIAWAMREAGGEHVSFLGRKWGPFPAVKSLLVSSRGRRAAWVVADGGDHLYVNGEKMLTADRILPHVRFNADSSIGLLTLAGREVCMKYVELPRGKDEIADETTYERVIASYFDQSLECVKNQETFDATEAWEKAAKAGGFKSKREFDEWVSRWGDADAAARISKKLSEAYVQKIEELAKKDKQKK